MMMIASGQLGVVARPPYPMVCCVSMEKSNAVLKSYTCHKNIDRLTLQDTTANTGSTHRSVADLE